MPRPPAIPIAVVDDHPFMRNGIRDAVQGHGYATVVSAGNGEEYIAACATGIQVAIAVVDLVMPGMDGYATIAYITEHQPGTLPVAITFDPHDNAVHRALQAGARAVLAKNLKADELVQALDLVRTTGYYHNELVHRQLLHKPTAGSPEVLRAKARALLTPSELRFLMAYTEDDEPTAEQLAQRFHVSKSTVETHRKAVVEKTGEHSRMGLRLFTHRFHLRGPI